MNINAKHLALFVGCGMLISCSLPRANYVDTSNDKSYELLKGSEYVSVVQLEKVGVTDSAKYEKKVDYYLVVKSPGFHGPEVVNRVLIPAGTRIKVLDVLKCTNCLSEDDRVLISFEGAETTPPTYISGLIVNKGQGSIMFRDLSADAFEKVQTQK
jgi:hypothetical protein